MQAATEKDTQLNIKRFPGSEGAFWRRSGSVGNGIRVLQASPDHMHGVGRTDFSRILPSLSSSSVDQASDSVMREHQPVDLLEDQFRSLAPQRCSRSQKMGLNLIVSVLDFSSFVIQAGELAGRECAGVEKRRREPVGFAGRFREPVLHHPDPANTSASPTVDSRFPQFRRPRTVLERLAR